MIFDIHAHLMGEEVPGKAFWDGFTRLAAVQTGRSEERVRSRLPDIWDLTGEQLIQDMDDAGVDRVMVMPVDCTAEVTASPESNASCSTGSQTAKAYTWPRKTKRIVHDEATMSQP